MDDGDRVTPKRFEFFIVILNIIFQHEASVCTFNHMLQIFFYYFFFYFLFCFCLVNKNEKDNGNNISKM